MVDVGVGDGCCEDLLTRTLPLEYVESTSKILTLPLECCRFLDALGLQNVHQSFLHLPPSPSFACTAALCHAVQDDSALERCVLVCSSAQDDPVETGRALSRSTAATEAELRDAESALSDAKAFLLPVLERDELTRHALLGMALGHSRTALMQLECLAGV